MLEIQKGDLRATELRAILLFEPDCNHMKKWIGQEIMFTAEELQAIAPEHHGSRKQIVYQRS
jgi:hypothetical protein